MRVGHQLSPDAGQCKELAKYLNVTFGGLWNPNNVAFEPALDLAPSVFRGEWPDENASVGHDTQKAQKYGPR